MEENEIVEVKEVEEIVPSMNLNLPMEQEKPELIKDEQLIKIYDEVLDNLREDRKQASELLDTFSDMVINGGEASSATKEAVVNLMKAKMDTADKMSKIADLMTRIKLRDRDTMPKYLKAQQNNKINITQKKELTTQDKRDLLRMMDDDEN